MFIKRVTTSEIKTDENTSEVLDQDQTDGIPSVTSKMRDVASSRRFISDPMVKN